MQDWIQVSTPALPLTPLMLPWMMRALRSQQLPSALAEFGSPLHIIHPEPFGMNVRSFTDVARAYGVPLRTYFARKCCRSQGFIQEAVRLQVGVDCASFDELRQSLELGVAPDKLLSTTPVLSDETIELLVRHQILTVVDSESDIIRLSQRAREHGTQLPVLIRLSGFFSNGVKLTSRFGFDIETFPSILDGLSAEVWSGLTVQGLHFHLDGYNPEHRVDALFQLRDLLLHLRRLGHPVQQVNIGGGFLVCYLHSPAEWERFLAAHAEGVADPEKRFWNGDDTWGVKVEADGKLIPPRLYPFSNALPRGAFLQRILEGRRDGVSAAHLIQQLGITIGIEPGRSLVDQCGLTVARFGGTKALPGRCFSTLEMNQTHLKAVSVEFCVDPLYLARGQCDEESSGCLTTLVGDYCMESDVILRRRIHFPHAPQAGDLIAFPNTAGYMMHLFQSPGHRETLPKLVQFDEKSHGFVLGE